MPGQRQPLARSRPLLALLLFASLIPWAPGPLFSADPIAMPGLDGGSLSEADLESGNTILIVWASWSPHCRDIVERANRVHQAWSSRAEVRTLVFQEKPEAVRAFLAGQRLASPTFIDAQGAFSKKHAVTSLPGLLIFKDGELAFGGKLPPNPDPLIRRTLD